MVKKAIIIVLIVFVILAILFFRFSETHGYCRMCHYMEIYYKNWEQSTHSKVECVQCHFEPGMKSFAAQKVATIRHLFFNIMRRRETSPRVEISDKSCMADGCHSDKTSPAKITFKKVEFDHSTHLKKIKRGKQLKCTSCHNEIVQGRHISVTEQVCYLCHFKGMEKGEAVSGCGTCHKKLPEEISFHEKKFLHSVYVKSGLGCSRCHSDVVQGDGRVEVDRCYNCHKEIKRGLKYEETEFIHDKHVAGKGINCFSCHEKIAHKIIKMSKTIELNCVLCHAKKHNVQEEMYMGIGAGGLKNDPDLMFLSRVDCSGCHKQEGGGRKPARTEILTECDKCHGAGYSGLAVKWQENVRKKLTEIKELLKNKTSSPAFGLVKDNLDFIEKDGSFGVHNVRYVLDILKNAETLLWHKAGSAGYASVEKCSKCHFGSENQIVEKNFNHLLHTGKRIVCNVCHSERTHKKIYGEKCASCHHDIASNKQRCGVCHPAQQKLAGARGIMSIDKVACFECHGNKERRVRRSLEKDCVECHSDDYVVIMREWIENHETQMKKLNALLKEIENEKRKAKGDQKKYGGITALENQASDLFKLVSEDKSRGIHNPEYLENGVTGARKKLDEIKKL